MKILKKFDFGAWLGAFIIVFTLTGCNDRVIERPSHMDITYRVVVIDGCQYIDEDRGISHKGNCTNSIHLYRAEDSIGKH